jgi:nucleoid-associated protein YgaU
MTEKMSKFAGLGAGPVLGIAGAVVAGAVALGVYLLSQRAPDPQADRPVESATLPAPQAAVPPVPDVSAAPTDAPGDVPAAEVAEDTASERAEPEAASASADAPDAAPMPAPPALDTFRLEADGRMLVAGRAVPGGSVAILVDEARLGQTEADGAGKFVAFLDLPPAEVARALSLSLLLPDGREVRSREDILIAPTPRAVPEVAVADPPAEDASGEASVDVAATPPERPATTAPDAPVTPEPPVETASVPAGITQPAAQSTPEPPTVLLSDEAGVRVLQAPVGPGPEVQTVALDSISYSDAGEVELAGRASAAEGFVRIYVDNRPVTTSRIGEDGSWRSDLPDVDSGIYTLRVDEVGPDGAVTSRVETPFKREDARAFVSADTPIPPRMSVVTVQPGSTLWAISRERYGEGILYVRVFEANRDRIRDPDLIYPGQVFELPE